MGVFTLLNDVTTDLDDPPRFEAVLALRPAGANAVEHSGPAAAAKQRKAYPQVRPILTALPAGEAFDRALRVAEGMGWEIVEKDRGRGIVEAVDTSRIFRFKDDIVIRVRAAPEGARLDLRSKSRVGRGDLGKNASRILEFTRRFTRG